MADVAWPVGAVGFPAVFEIGLRSNVQIAVSSYNGSIQTSEIPGSRWVVKVSMPVNTDATNYQPIWDAIAASARGQANRLVLGHMKRPEPRGTMRGLPTSGGAAQGALSMVVNGTGTLLAGDMIGVTTTSGSQLLMVTADATGGGTVVFSPPLKAAVTAGSSVVWNYPTARFIVMSQEIMVSYGPSGENPGVVLDLMEVF